MDKQKSKKINPPKKVPSQQNLVINHVKNQLMMKVSIPVFVIIIFLSLFIIKSPYTAKESYKEMVNVTEPVTKVITDMNNPQITRVCEKIPIPISVSLERAYGNQYGVSGYKCYGTFRVTNKGDADGEWNFSYIFNISGLIVQTDPVTQMIPKYTSFTFTFETTDCKPGDTVEGHYQIESSPESELCKNEVSYNTTVTVNETVQQEVQRERIITKYETLWQKLTGYNRNEKI